MKILQWDPSFSMQTDMKLTVAERNFTTGA